MKAVQTWADTLPSYYSGYHYSNIAAMLLEEKRLAEFDQFFPEVARVMSTYDQPMENWTSLMDKLIEIGDFERYMRLLNMLDKGTEETKLRQKSMLRRLGKQVETEDTPQALFMVRRLLAAGQSGKIPEGVIEGVWPRYIRNCQQGYPGHPEFLHDNARLPDAREIMGKCYLRLIDTFDRYNNLKNLRARL